MAVLAALLLHSSMSWTQDATTNPRGRDVLMVTFEILRYNEDRPYTILKDSELSVVAAAIKVCLVPLHYDVDDPSDKRSRL